ncbi:MAG: hypothetical protein AB1749_02215 [Pseudomonadota bacterium]
MAGRSSYATDNHDYDGDTAIDDVRRMARAFQSDDFGDFYPGEPISAPRRRRGSSMAGAFLIVSVLSLAGWGLYETEAWWRPTAGVMLERALAALRQARNESATPDKAALATALPTVVAPLPSREFEAAPGAEAGVAMPSAPAAMRGSLEKDADAGSTETADEEQGSRAPTDDELPAAPLPPPEIDPADPYQKRALAAGLHPQLSRVLLSRMTDADYRNARIAIDKAISETGDRDKLIWPRQREPKSALFQVHFVVGAAPDCRRYVVTVTKDGWSTTALPMERCGVKPPGAAGRQLQGAARRTAS